VSQLLELSPYGARRDAEFLNEMNELTRLHIERSPALARVWRNWRAADQVEEIPFLHVGVFKSIDFRQNQPGRRFVRTLESSSTTGSNPSRIPLDEESSGLQARSVAAILSDFVGGGKRPLLVIDSGQSLRMSGAVSARIAAALSLRPLASDLFFLLDSQGSGIAGETLKRAVDDAKTGGTSELLVYGFTWALWQTWEQILADAELSRLIAGVRLTFLHSGGWKKLENQKVSRNEFDTMLRASGAEGSRVLDFYGLVEQVGVVYPLCESGSRHVPVWADVFVRDSYTMHSLTDEPGQLALMNCLAKGAPYHSVLTEDLGRIIPGDCPCGRSGKRFELLGRIPKSELRGCANV
jgi:hypothetical protein